MSLLDALWGDNSKSYKEAAQAYDPYVSAGKQSLQDLLKQQAMLTQSPWQLQDEIASHYQESPGLQYAQNQITQRMNNQAALSGRLGSGASQRSLQDALTGQLLQEQGQYVNRGMDTFNTGLGVEQGMNQLGYNALGQQNNLNMQAAQSHNAALGHMLGFGIQAGMNILDPGASMGQAFGDLGKRIGFNSTGGVGSYNYGSMPGYSPSYSAGYSQNPYQSNNQFSGTAYADYMPGGRYGNMADWGRGL